MIEEEIHNMKFILKGIDEDSNMEIEYTFVEETLPIVLSNISYFLRGCGFELKGIEEISDTTSITFNLELKGIEEISDTCCGECNCLSDTTSITFNPNEHQI